MLKMVKKEKTSINTVSHDAPIHLRGTMFHQGGATNAHDAFRILHDDITVEDECASTCFLYCISAISS